MKKIFTFILTAFLILPVISQSTVKQQLEKILSAGCVKDGVIVSMESTNPSLQLAIKQESSRTPGKFRYVFVDKRIGAFNENGKFEFSASKMSCPQLSENSSQSSSSSNEAAVALLLGMLELSGGSSNNSSTYSNENEHNSYQCNRCALVSRSTKEPGSWEFGGNGGCNGSTISGKSHDWNKANTNKGWQCTGCGIKSFLIKGEPGGWEFGGSGACNGGSHYWRSF